MDETAQGEHLNYWPQIQEFMKSINYTLVRADWHTPERISLEAYFVKNELAEKIVDKTEKQNLLRGSYNTKYPFLRTTELAIFRNEYNTFNKGNLTIFKNF